MHRWRRSKSHAIHSAYCFLFIVDLVHTTASLEQRELPPDASCSSELAENRWRPATRRRFGDVSAIKRTNNGDNPTNGSLGGAIARHRERRERKESRRAICSARYRASSRLLIFRYRVRTVQIPSLGSRVAATHCSPDGNSRNPSSTTVHPLDCCPAGVSICFLSVKRRAGASRVHLLIVPARCYWQVELRACTS